MKQGILASLLFAIMLISPLASAEVTVDDGCTGTWNNTGPYKSCNGIHYDDEGNIDCIGHWRELNGQESCSLYG